MSVIGRLTAWRQRNSFAPFSPASDPPKVPETVPTVTPWAEWNDKITTHYTPPGWTFCKFAFRPQIAQAAE